MDASNIVSDLVICTDGAVLLHLVNVLQAAAAHARHVQVGCMVGVPLSCFKAWVQLQHVGQGHKRWCQACNAAGPVPLLPLLVTVGIPHHGA